MKDFSTRVLVAWELKREPATSNSVFFQRLSSFTSADDQITCNSGNRALAKFHFVCLLRGHRHVMKLLLTCSTTRTSIYPQGYKKLLRKPPAPCPPYKASSFYTVSAGSRELLLTNHSLNSTFSTSHLKAPKIVFCFTIFFSTKNISGIFHWKTQDRSRIRWTVCKFALTLKHFWGPLRGAGKCCCWKWSSHSTTDWLTEWKEFCSGRNTFVAWEVMGKWKVTAYTYSTGALLDCGNDTAAPFLPRPSMDC